MSGSDGRLTVHANDGDKIGTRTVTEGIFAQGNLTIVKNGNNTITVSATSGYSEGWREMYNLNDDSRGIHCYGNLVIDGKGTKGGATVIGQNENNLYGVSYGISSLKDIEIKDGAKVIAKGSKGDKAGRVSCGLYAGNTIKVSGDKTIVEAYGGTISSFGDRTKESNSDNISYGIMVGTYTFDYYGTPGSINIEGGTVTAKGGGTSEYHKDPKENGQRVRSIGMYTNALSIGNASVITEGADPNPGLSYGTYIKTDKAYILSVRYGKLTGKGYTGAIVCSRSINYDTPILEGSTSYSGSLPVLKDDYDNSWKYATMDAKRVVIDIDDWTYGETAKIPSVHNLNKYGDGNVTATCKFNVDNPTNVGLYRASATLSNGMTGFKTINILPRNISDAVITFGTQEEYNGSSQEVVISSVKCGGKTLVKDTDYTITSGGSATNVGDTLLYIAGKKNYSGTKTGTWSLQKATLHYTDFSNINSRESEHIIYDGNYKTVTTPVKSGVGKITVWYYKYETKEWATRVKEPGNYYVYFDVEESNNYKVANKLTYGDQSVRANRMTINKKYGEPVECVPTARVKAGQTVDLMVNTAGALGRPSFQIEDGNDNTAGGGCRVDSSSGLFTAGSGIGTCKVTVKSTATEYYMGWRSSVTAYITVTVDNKESAALTVTQGDITFGDSPAPAWTPNITSPTVKYSGTKHDGSTYSETTTKPTEAGNYTVTVTGESGIYSYSGSKSFSINPKNVEGTVITFGSQSTYDGTNQNVVIDSVKLGGNTLTASDDYEILFGGAAEDVEDQQVEIQGKGNYTGTATSAAKWKLKKKTPVAGDFSVTAASTRDYTGESAIPVPEPSLNSGRTGCGDITIYYTGTGTTSYAKNVTPPADAGLYDVTFDVAEGSNFSSATGLTYGTLTIKKVDFTGDKEISSVGQIDRETILDLTSYANDGTWGIVTVTEGDGYLSAAPTITGKKLKFTFKNGTAVGSEATVTVPVTNCKNYNDYTLTVTLTARQQYTLEHVAASEPTCTMNGNKEYWFATDEDGIYFYDENGTQPTFEKDIIIRALGHDWGEWKVTREATHTVPGEETRECKREGCQAKETREIPLVPYTITFSLNGKPGAAPVSQNIINGNKAAEPAAPTADGFTFLGWFKDAAGEDYYDFNTPVTGNITLYAKWVSKEVKLYTVSFDLNGKDGTKPADQKVPEGGTAGSPGNPASAGFIFRGWYTDKDCKSLYDFSDPVTADITLYARWEEDVPPGAFKIFYTESELKFDPYKGLTYNTGNEHYEWTYTGSALKPAITVTDHKGNVLTEGSDYTVKYTGNKDVSAKPAKVTVTGKGNFAGSRSLEFYILKADLAKAKAKKMLIIPDSFAVQKGKKISPVVIYQGVTLDPKKDYKLSNTGAIKEDTTVDIEGKGTFFTGKISGIPVKAFRRKRSETIPSR
ncbi:MAG: InlB B-repeat-containing protein [Lachnospiraceae bacterium]|nr:InlB B-repeat-containing protein [Lachnospiraceae bacterium]